MRVDQLISTIENAITSIKIPDIPTPEWLICCTSQRRSGQSITRAISNCIGAMEAAGIPTGKMPDGSDNLYVSMASAIISAVMNEQLDNAYVELVTPPGAIITTGTGGNAGGQVTVVGTNTNYSKGCGIIK